MSESEGEDRGWKGNRVRKSQFSIRNAGGKFSWHEINRKT